MVSSLDHYRIFYHVAKYGGFSQAARILYANQPNLSRVISRLEEELGCLLFVRSKKGTSLTPEGEKLYRHVEAAMEHFILAEEEIKNTSDLRSGQISVAVSEIALHGMLLPVLQRFKEAYPGIRIRILNHSTKQGIRAVADGIVDLALITTPMDLSPQLIMIPVRSFQNIAAAGNSFRSLEGKRLSLKDLCAYPLISLGKETTTYDFYQRLFTEQGLELELSVEAATTDQILPMVSHGIGIGFLPSSFAEDALRRGQVFRIALTEDIPDRHICIVREKHRPLRPAAEKLEQMIREYADKSRT